jgi:hypothetical protein
VKIKVEVKRPSGTPVITGTVAFRLNPGVNGEAPKKIDQTPVRDAAGVWTLSLRKLPAGVTSGYVAFVDQTNTHAENRQDLSFTLLQGTDVTPSPTPKPTAVPVPVDTCKDQIRN